MEEKPGSVKAAVENATKPTWSKLFRVAKMICMVISALLNRAPGCMLVIVFEISNRITMVFGPVIDEIYHGRILGS
jgi:hypothetical protein